MHLIRLAALLLGAAILEGRRGRLGEDGPSAASAADDGGSGLSACLGRAGESWQPGIGRLMGVYIALFFVVSQIIAVLAFGQMPSLRTAAAGGLMIAAAAVVMV